MSKTAAIPMDKKIQSSLFNFTEQQYFVLLLSRLSIFVTQTQRATSSCKYIHDADKKIKDVRKQHKKQFWKHCGVMSDLGLNTLNVCLCRNLLLTLLWTCLSCMSFWYVEMKIMAYNMLQRGCFCFLVTRLLWVASSFLLSTFGVEAERYSVCIEDHSFCGTFSGFKKQSLELWVWARVLCLGRCSKINTKGCNF